MTEAQRLTLRKSGSLAGPAQAGGVHEQIGLSNEV
jgi:hypothetical protein